MGKIWLETSGGNLIHLPVVGVDVNSPDDAVKIPTSLIMSINRCWSNQIVAIHPTYGTITIDLRPPGMAGSCNQCGHCCTHLPADCPHPPLNCGYVEHTHLPIHICQYLDIDNRNKWPDPNNTSCTLYATILDGPKGCAFPPPEINPLWINCGFSF